MVDSRGWVRLGSGPEFDRIRAFADAAGGRVTRPEVVVPPGDDAVAIRPPPGTSLLIGSDMSIEEVHFRRAWVRWEPIGYRATAAALSDLGAMGGEAIGALVSLALPPELDSSVGESIAAGVGECLARFDAVLLGGDMSQSPGPVAVDVVAIGYAERPVTRAGAAPGDEVWITGSLGGAATAVADWRNALEPDPRARRAFERPEPRVREGAWLNRELGVTAMIDISDGLVGDAGHLAAASGVGLDITLSSVPISPLLAEYVNRELALRRALTGGEDYELLCTVPAGGVGERRRAFEQRFGTRLTRIGQVTEREVRWLDDAGRVVQLIARAYDHFAGDG